MDYTLESLSKKMREILPKWHNSTRPGNDGDAGNTLEDLLGIPENNLSLPDFGEFEIKTIKFENKTHLTLLHKEPEPGEIVPKLIEALGWRHQEAGRKYPLTEKSFRSTTYGHTFSVRGFSLSTVGDKINFIFDPQKVSRAEKDKTNVYSTYGDWLKDVENRKSPNYSELFPIYYKKDDLVAKLKEKLENTMLATRQTRSNRNQKQYKYIDVFLMSGFRGENLDNLIEDGSLVVDFDARTGHNHGTKIRIKKNDIVKLFNKFQKIA